MEHCSGVNENEIDFNITFENIENKNTSNNDKKSKLNINLTVNQDDSFILEEVFPDNEQILENEENDILQPLVIDEASANSGDFKNSSITKILENVEDNILQPLVVDEAPPGDFKNSSITKVLRGIKRFPRSRKSESDVIFIERELVGNIPVETHKDLNIGGLSEIKDDGQLLKIQEKAKEVTNYECPDCGKSFREKSHLATHSRAHVDVRNFKCDKCGLSFKTRSNLKFHLGTHSETPFTCAQCNKVYPERKMLHRHIRIVHSIERHECDQCGRWFKTLTTLTSHYSMHTGVKPFPCSLCDKAFVYRSTLTSHLKDHEAAKSCSLCIDSRSNLCTHLTKAWLCTVCGKSYRFKGTLNAHMKTHQPDKPFKCSECPKSFIKKQSYEDHVRQHQGEGPQFMCDQCSLSYYNQFALKRHYMKHISQRSFYCQVCSKSFWMKDALKVHMRSHSSLKMFKCGICGKSFSHKHTLDVHSRSHHKQQQSKSVQPSQQATYHIL